MTSIGRTLVRGAVALVVVVLAMPAASAGGPPGTLDRSFGNGGRLSMGFGAADAYGRAVAHQGAKIVVAGTHELQTTADVAVARLNPGGGFDRTFGGDGRVTVNLGGYEQASAIAVLTDGKILVAGSRDTSATRRFMVLRLTKNGHLDHTFGGGDGFVTTGFGNAQSSAYGLAVLKDGRFVVCGGTTASSDQIIAVARYRPDGRLDPSFGNHGLVETTFPGQPKSICLAVALDGNKTVIAGDATDTVTESIFVARLGPGGGADLTFNNVGYRLIPATQSSARGVVVLPSGGVVAAGYAYSPTTNYDPILVQLTARGRLDHAFGGGDGVAMHDVGGSDIGEALVRQKDGRLIVVGFTDDDMFVARYRENGNLDPTFGKHGVQAKPWSGRSSGEAAVAMKGTVVVVGALEGAHYKLAVERVLAG